MDDEEPTFSKLFVLAICCFEVNHEPPFNGRGLLTTEVGKYKLTLNGNDEAISVDGVRHQPMHIIITVDGNAAAILNIESGLIFESISGGESEMINVFSSHLTAHGRGLDVSE